MLKTLQFPRRKIHMAKSIKAKQKPEDLTPIYTWAFKSSKAPLTGGQTFDYVTQLNQDATLSCNCPGWRFVKKGQPRSCKHTRIVNPEVSGIMEMFRNGETMPILESPVPAHAPTAPTTEEKTSKPKHNPNSKIRFGRVIEY